MGGPRRLEASGGADELPGLAVLIPEPRCAPGPRPRPCRHGPSADGTRWPPTPRLRQTWPTGAAPSVRARRASARPGTLSWASRAGPHPGSSRGSRRAGDPAAVGGPCSARDHHTHHRGRRTMDGRDVCRRLVAVGPGHPHARGGRRGRCPGRERPRRCPRSSCGSRWRRRHAPGGGPCLPSRAAQVGVHGDHVARWSGTPHPDPEADPDGRRERAPWSSRPVAEAVPRVASKLCREIDERRGRRPGAPARGRVAPSPARCAPGRVVKAGASAPGLPWSRRPVDAGGRRGIVGDAHRTRRGRDLLEHGPQGAGEAGPERHRAGDRGRSRGVEAAIARPPAGAAACASFMVAARILQVFGKPDHTASRSNCAGADRSSGRS